MFTNLRSWKILQGLMCLAFFPAIVHAQFENQPQTNNYNSGSISSVYAELLGNGYLYSLNYDYVNPEKLGFRFGITPGFDFSQDEADPDYQTDDSNSQTFQVLLMGNHLFGKGMHRMELGAGAIFGFSEETENLILPNYPAFTSTIGYRMFPPENKYTLKVAFTPIISNGELIPTVGFSFGPFFSH